MSLRFELDKDLEQRFREAAMKVYGYEKGSLKKAAEEAIGIWVNMEKNGIEKVEDPIKLIEGIFSKVKGKSVELQHESKKL